MIFMDFEKPLETLYGQLEKLQKIADDSDIDMTGKIKEIEEKLKKKGKKSIVSLQVGKRLVFLDTQIGLTHWIILK